MESVPDTEIQSSPNLHTPKIPPTKPNKQPRIVRWVPPMVRFIRTEAGSGVLLLISAALAMVLMNVAEVYPIDGHNWYHYFWEKTKLGISAGDFALEMSLHHFINDVLMTIFFFVVGLEIKRELVAGELREPRKAALPALAALGGMVVPAAVYYYLQAGQPGEGGWGIPMATDIAFVVGVLALLGSRVPVGLKVLLLSLAIVDDIGAVVVIALFYSDPPVLLYLGLAASGFLVVVMCRQFGLWHIPVYVFLGILIWLAFYYSGVHTTVAGVILGLLTPSVPREGEQTLHDELQGALEHVKKRLYAITENGDQNTGHDNSRQQAMGQLVAVAAATVPPLERLERTLHPWVAYGIMPLFALANAGVVVDLGVLGHPVALSVTAGLLLGKPVGILLFSLLAVLLRLGQLPTGVSWTAMVGAGCLGGVGFTMSLFIASLGLEDTPVLLAAGKTGTLVGSLLSGILGCVLLWRFLPRSSPTLENSRGEFSSVH